MSAFACERVLACAPPPPIRQLAPRGRAGRPLRIDGGVEAEVAIAGRHTPCDLAGQEAVAGISAGACLP